ncbi:MAG TPA: amidohydrolase family protein, partial [Burkholderiales bacterium]
MKVIALEEHYWDQELASQFKERGPEMRIPALQERLFDVDALRIREMDEAGIDLQVLSHGAPATQRLDAQSAVPVARKVNDKLRETVKRHPGRYEAFAVLPTADPKASADELERAVTKLGFKGAMIHGLTLIDGTNYFIDDKRFWPIFERAQALDVPLYMHPAVPHKAVIEAYYRDYLEQFPGLMTAAWGFTVETAT